jgi:hypothetical protein
MAAHWTYDSVASTDHLEQGDILKPTDALKAIFASVHPHFKQDKYLGFLVATQSCDLVMRAGTPKAAYINLAVIRPLSQVIKKILAETVPPAAAGIFRARDKVEARRLLERLLNQNEQAIGLFFLHRDWDVGIGEPAVAFLRVSVALRSDHYQTIKEARVGRLAPEFRAKLGWLIGNLFARPATPDWADKGKERDFEELIAQYLREAQWIDEEILAAAKEKKIDLANATLETLETLRPPSRLERALGEVQVELSKVAPELDPEKIKKLQNRLRNSGKFTKLFKGSLEIV